MLIDDKKSALGRALIGGLCGWGVLFLIGYIAGSFSLWGPSSFRGFQFVDGLMENLFGSEALAIGVQFVLFFILGALAGIATMPFADTGKVLFLRSAVHFVATEAMVWVTVMLNFAGWENPIPYMKAMAVVYAVIWGLRWLCWWFELGAIRKKLGLTRKKDKEGGK